MKLYFFGFEVILSSRKEVEEYSGKALIQVRGVHFVCFMFCICFHAVLDLLECVRWRLSLFAFSGNSQKPPGGVEGP